MIFVTENALEEHIILKGIVQRDFRPTLFFIIRTCLHGQLTNGLKYIRFWLRFRIFISSYTSYDPGVSDPGESN